MASNPSIERTANSTVEAADEIAMSTRGAVRNSLTAAGSLPREVVDAVLGDNK